MVFQYISKFAVVSKIRYRLISCISLQLLVTTVLTLHVKMICVCPVCLFSCFYTLPKFHLSFIDLYIMVSSHIIIQNRNIQMSGIGNSLRWRHNGRNSVSNHQPHDCLLNRLFRRRSKKTSKLRITGLCAGNSPGWEYTWRMICSTIDTVFDNS